MQEPVKKILKIVAAVLAFALLAGILVFANGLVGNPISRFLANRTAKTHINTTYPGLELDLSKASYNFKSGNYQIQAVSPTSEDTHFSLYFTPASKLQRDDYAYRVLERHNTYERINDEYNQIIKTVFAGTEFPYTLYLNYGRIQSNDTRELWPGSPAYGINREELVLDRIYDVRELGKTAGNLVLYVEDDLVTVARVAEILLDIKRLCDNHEVGFYALDFELTEPRGEKGFDPEAARISIREFGYEEISEPGLAERIAAAHQALQEYYTEQDSKRKR